MGGGRVRVLVACLVRLHVARGARLMIRGLIKGLVKVLIIVLLNSAVQSVLLHKHHLQHLLQIFNPILQVLNIESCLQKFC